MIANGVTDLDSPEHFMRKDLHPEFREVVFKDVSCDWEILTKSTIKAKETITKDGKEYPLVKVDISSQSHPFYTGKQRLIDTEGRAEKFRKKYGKK
jgi:large subunit ribosomal protein L31